MVEDHVNRVLGAILQPLTAANSLLDRGAIMIGRSCRAGRYHT